jgi:hypothetical protein
MTSYLDLSGLLLAQSNYLTSLNSGSDADISKLRAIDASLGMLLSNWNRANQSSTQVVTNQDKVNSIVQTELTRLQTKKGDIDTAMEGQKRSIQLNDSYRKRFQHYTKMVMIVIVCLAIFVGLILVGRYFPVIPSFVIDILCVLTVSTGIVYTYLIYLDIQSRAKTNFDELSLQNPSLLSTSDIQKKTANAAGNGDLLGSVNFGTCVGSACCSDASGTVWDASQSMCVVKPTTSFTTMFVSQQLGDLSKTPKANAPYEYTQYAKV